MWKRAFISTHSWAVTSRIPPSSLQRPPRWSARHADHARSTSGYFRLNYDINWYSGTPRVLVSSHPGAARENLAPLFWPRGSFLAHPRHVTLRIHRAPPKRFQLFVYLWSRRDVTTRRYVSIVLPCIGYAPLFVCSLSFFYANTPGRHVFWLLFSLLFWYNQSPICLGFLSWMSKQEVLTHRRRFNRAGDRSDHRRRGPRPGSGQTPIHHIWRKFDMVLITYKLSRCK